MSMAAITRLKTIASISSIIYIFTILCSATSLRQALSRIFSPSSHPVRFAALLIALLLNSKSLPLIWHLRFFRSMITQLYSPRNPLPRDALFRPIVTSSVYTPVPEMDYNGHKSNSTYFSDLDMARTELVTCLLRKGIRNAGARKLPELPLTKSGEYQASVDVPKTAPAADAWSSQQSYTRKPTKALFAIALGAVSCHFKREIKPYQSYEIWTRILSWDRKWIYIVSHMVEPEAILPEQVALQPLKKSRASHSAYMSSGEQREHWKKAIFATSLAKYVVKRGRQTVPPELVLSSSDLLPPKPGEEDNGNSIKPLFGKLAKASWTWQGVDRERERGLRLAEHFGALDGPDGLHDEFPVAHGNDNPHVEVLGYYKDLYV